MHDVSLTTSCMSCFSSEAGSAVDGVNEDELMTSCMSCFSSEAGSAADGVNEDELMTSDRKSTRLNSSHTLESRMPSSA